jgi:two-component system, chemotaxis family, chemotaxis protein CheY
MENLTIICVDDQREVLNALIDDLGALESHVKIEECESANEAFDLAVQIDNEGDYLALVITDQVMPQNTGVSLLKKLKNDGRFNSTKKILLTGLATHQDTIDAINSANLDNYIEKPWNKADLIKIVKTLLTKYLFEKGIEYQSMLDVVDSETLMNMLKKQTG